MPDISQKLEELGMVKLPKTKETNGFSDVVTFVITEYVKAILLKKYNLQQDPDIAIIRKGKVKGKGKSIRIAGAHRLVYSLAFYDDVDSKFRIVKDDTGKSVKRVLGSIIEYVTSEGDLFTAEKYAILYGILNDEILIKIDIFRKIRSLYIFLDNNGFFDGNSDTSMKKKMILLNTNVQTILEIINSSNQADWESDPIKYFAYFEIVEEWYEGKTGQPLGFKGLSDPIEIEEHAGF